MSKRDRDGVCADCGYPDDPCRCDRPLGDPAASWSEERRVTTELRLQRGMSIVITMTSKRSAAGSQFEPPTIFVSSPWEMDVDKADLIGQAIARTRAEFMRRWPS